MFFGGFIFEWIQAVLVLAGYVNGSAAFPEALTPEEEKKYISLYMQGDMSAKNTLIEHNLRLVAHIAKKFGDEKNIEDLISIGTIGLIKGVNTFNPEKSKKLSTYIARCVENELLMYLRFSKKFAGEVSIDEGIGTDKEGNSMTFSDILTIEGADVAEEIFRKLETAKLYSAMEKVLTPSERDIITGRYGLNNTKRKTQREIAQIMGISRSYISRIEKKCIEKLSEELSEA